MSDRYKSGLMARTCLAFAGAAIAATVLVSSSTPSVAEPSGTVTVAWPRVYSFVGVPAKNGGRQGERLVWLGVHESAERVDADTSIVPHLAESWTISDDGTVHTLKLRKGVQFHGGWGEMTAEDWKWTADNQWQGKPVSNHGGQFIATSNLKETRVVDKYTVEFVLKRPNAFFREYYGSVRDDVALAVYSKKRMESMGDEAAETKLPDGGTGPYQVVSWNSDTSIELKAFPGYWGDQPDYETVKIVQISEPSTVMAGLETGSIDAAKIPVTARKRAEAAGLKVEQAGIGFARVTFAGQFCYKEFDGKKIPTRPGYDPSLPWVGDCDNAASMAKARQVRYAMSMAIDRQALVDAIAGGHGRPSYVDMLQGFFADKFMQDKWVVPYDRAKAKQLLADSGYPNGFKFDMVCEASGHPLTNEFCEAIGAMWAAAGMQPEIRRLAPDAFRKQQVARTFNGIKVEVESGVTPIPEARGFGELPTAAFNSGFEMPGLVALVRQASLAVSAAERDKIRAKQYEWSYDQHLRIPLAEFDEIFAYNPKKIGEWNRTPFNGHAEELMDFEHLKKPK